MVLLDTLIRPLSSAGQVVDVCGARYQFVPACTQFVGSELRAECRREKTEWSIDATARVTALVYVVNHKYTQHELQHVGDMRSDVRRLIAQLQSRRYADAGACEADALDAASTFRAQLGAFATESNARRH